MKRSPQASTQVSLRTTQSNDAKVLYFGQWMGTADPSGQEHRRCNRPYHACVFAFRGPTVRWLGSQGPDHGFAEVFVDGVAQGIVDAYAPTARASQALFEKTGLDTGRIHTLRIVVRRERNQAATDCFQGIAAFESRQPVDYPVSLRRAAAAELRAITSGTKTYLGPDAWWPVAYAAVAPVRGVTLQPGPLRDCFDRNIIYLNRCFAEPYYNDAGYQNWVEQLPASGEGRMLAGAGHTLRWGERADMREIVSTIVSTVKARQTADGYCLPYDVTFMDRQKNHWKDERRNYDRVGLTRGMLAAGMSGDPDAYGVMRRFYDWLNPSPYYAQLLTGEYHGSAHNCNNGHAGGLLVYFSPVGKDADLVAVERYFVQDFFIDQAKNAEPLSLAYYPLHTPHSYVLLAFEAWLDHYRATGASKYLEAAQGAWRIVKDSYEHVGGTVAICEMGPGAYPPGSYHLGKHTGETCGSVFWADFNHRFLQLYPNQERYAAEIEKVIYNVILAAQDDRGSIRYHSNLHGTKETPQAINTCCEVMGVPFIARLPQYIYSLADDGAYVNLFAASTVTWQQGEHDVTLTTSTDFPFGSRVTLALTSDAPVQMKLRVRVPSWAGGDIAVYLNDAVAAMGTPGGYVTLDRTWANHDRISFDLPLTFRLARYTGFDGDNPHGQLGQQDKRSDRYALEYGPVLMALVGRTDLNIPADQLASALSPIPGRPLHFSVAGHPANWYLPYWQVQTELFTCFPTMR